MLLSSCILFACLQNNYVRAFIETGVSKVLNNISEVVVTHKDGYVIPVKVRLSNAKPRIVIAHTHCAYTLSFQSRYACPILRHHRQQCVCLRAS